MTGFGCTVTYNMGFVARVKDTVPDGVAPSMPPKLSV
jgi:hypothetical protein